MHTKRLRNLKNVHFEIDFRICWKFFVKVGNRGDGGGYLGVLNNLLQPKVLFSEALFFRYFTRS